MNRIDEIIYEETQKAAYEEQCLYDFIHQEQPNEDYFEGINDYIDETMSIWNSHLLRTVNNRKDDKYGLYIREINFMECEIWKNR